LDTVGVVRQETDKGEAFRFVHDMLSDHITEAEEFAIRSDLQKAIERLSDRRISRLTPVPRFARLLLDIGRGEIGAIFIAAYIVYGLLLILSAWRVSISGWSANAFCPFLNSAMHSHYPSWLVGWLSDCDTVGMTYPIIYVMHVVWVRFIYYFDRGYFQYVFSRSRILRLATCALPVVGVFLGIILSLTPPLYLLPVTLIGMVMGLFLMYLGRSKFAFNQFARMNWIWGYKTVLNMLFASSVSVVLIFMLSPNPSYVAALTEINRHLKTIPFFPEQIANARSLTFGVIGALLLWFWYHIREEQESDISMAARLAELDRAREIRDE
jgi:hypothetical protein